MLNNGLYNGNKINDLKNGILDKILGQMRLYYTQIEENSNNLGGMFFSSSFFLLVDFSVFLQENKDFLF